MIQAVSECMKQHPSGCLGSRVDEFIANHVTLQGGGHPEPRAIRKLLAKLPDRTYYPGKPRENPGGRPRSISEHQEDEIARVAMSLKKRKIKPHPAQFGLFCQGFPITRGLVCRFPTRELGKSSRKRVMTMMKMIQGNGCHALLKTTFLKP